MTLGIYTGALDKLLEIGLKTGVGVMAYLYGTQGKRNVIRKVLDRHVAIIMEVNL